MIGPFIAEWPYALDCSIDNNEKNIFYINDASDNEYNVCYKKSSTVPIHFWIGSQGQPLIPSENLGKATGCVNKSILQLANEGRAYYFKYDAIVNHLSEN